MKSFGPKRMSWAGLLASGFTILSGLISSLFVILAFSDSPKRDAVVVAVVFGAIVLIPVWSLRVPRDPAVRKEKSRIWLFFRRKKREKTLPREWKRKRGQDSHQPFGTPDLPRPSTFVAAPRKPTEP